MRLTATSITVFSLILAASTIACTPEPPLDLKKELNKMGGPSPGTMGDSLKGQAENAMAARNYKVAAQTYKQLSDKEPDNKQYTLNLADSLRRAGSNQEALKVLDKYLEKNPADSAALETKGLCLMNLGNVAEAGKAFEEALKIEPGRWRTLNAVGILFTMKGKPQEAIEYYDEALRNSNGNVSVMNNKALTQAIDGKYEDSIDTFLQVRKQLVVGSPDIRQLDMNMALVYAIAGKLDDAEQAASPYLSKAALYNNMGVYADLAKNKNMAHSYLNMALTQSPTYYERAWKNLGALAEEEKDGRGGRRKLPKMTQITQTAAPSEPVEVKETAPKAPAKEPKEVAEKPVLKPPAPQADEVKAEEPKPAEAAPASGTGEEKKVQYLSIPPNDVQQKAPEETPAAPAE